MTNPLSRVACAMLVLSSLCAVPSRAQTTFIWDPAGTGTGSDGAGTWSTTSTVPWSNGMADVGTWNTLNTTTDTVQFGSTATTTIYGVSVAGTVDAAGIYLPSLTQASGITFSGVNGTGATIVGPTGGTFNVNITASRFGNTSMTGITFTGASTYQFTGSTLATQAQIGRTGVAFGAGTTFGGNLIFGTGSDQGTFIFKPSEFQLTASSTGTVTVNNGMDVLLNATGNITQDFILHGMGTSNILGTLDAQNTQNGTVTTLSGTIGLASDASIQASQNNGTSLTVTGTISSSNGSNLYLDYDSANSNTTSGATTYANATKLIIGGTGGSGSGTNSYGSTIISNSGNGDNGALNGGITGEAVMIGKDNALSTAGALILGVSGTTAVTLGDGTVITAPNSTNLTYGAGNVVTYTTSDGALDLNGHNQSFTGLVTNSALTASNQFIGNNSGIGTSTLTVTGNTSLATGFGGIIEDNFAAQQSVTGQAGGKVAFKVTSGAIKLTGANAYSGGTTVSGGTLTAGVASTSTTSAFGTPSSAMAVSGTGTLALNGFSQTFGAMTLSGSGIVSFGATGTTLSATSLNWAGGASDFALNLGAAYVTTSALTVGSLTESGTPHSYTFNFTGGTVGTTYDVMNLTSLGAAAATDFTSTGEAGTFTFSGNQLQFTLGATPEPSTWAMLLGGVALLVLSQRRLRGGSERL